MPNWPVCDHSGLVDAHLRRDDLHASHVRPTRVIETTADWKAACPLPRLRQVECRGIESSTHALTSTVFMTVPHPIEDALVVQRELHIAVDNILFRNVCSRLFNDN